MTPEELNRHVAALEALLFVHGEPLGRANIAAVLSVPDGAVEEVIRAYGARLETEERGLALLSGKDRVQLVTKSAFAPILERFVKEEVAEDLTPAALETLAIIAYLGPMSRATIEYYRGVNSSFTLRNLLIRGLVSRVADPAHSQSYLYESSFDLLKHLGLARKEDLPRYGELLEALEKLKKEEPAFVSPEPQGAGGPRLDSGEAKPAAAPAPEQ